MKKLFLLGLATVAIAVSATKSYSVELFQPAMLGSAALTPGVYKVDVSDQTATVRNGKVHGQAAVKVETGDIKYNTTTVQFDNQDGKMRIQEIHIGGTKTKLVFNE